MIHAEHPQRGSVDRLVPPQNELAWWDGDLLRDIHARGSIAKWKGPIRPSQRKLPTPPTNGREDAQAQQGQGTARIGHGDGGQVHGPPHEDGRVRTDVFLMLIVRVRIPEHPDPSILRFSTCRVAVR